VLQNQVEANNKRPHCHLFAWEHDYCARFVGAPDWQLAQQAVYDASWLH
jgi:hypothetical protein